MHELVAQTSSLTARSASQWNEVYWLGFTRVDLARAYGSGVDASLTMEHRVKMSDYTL